MQIERVHTLTLFYLAQVFGAKGNTSMSAEYCHLTLKRQYESKEFDPRVRANVKVMNTKPAIYYRSLHCIACQYPSFTPWNIGINKHYTV